MSLRSCDVRSYNIGGGSVIVSTNIEVFNFLSEYVIHFIDVFPRVAKPSFEPPHELATNVAHVCATSIGADQPVYTHSLIRAFASRLNSI